LDFQAFFIQIIKNIWDIRIIPLGAAII